MFANGGYKVAPYFITSAWRTLAGECWQRPRRCGAGEGAQRTIDSRNAFVMYNMMQDVIRGGTGARAMSLGRTDLAGKTGTTNDQMDAWFAGFQRNLTAWCGSGSTCRAPLGPNETGAVAALPIWISYHGRGAQECCPRSRRPVPEGVIAARINPETGLARPGTRKIR